MIEGFEPDITTTLAFNDFKVSSFRIIAAMISVFVPASILVSTEVLRRAKLNTPRTSSDPSLPSQTTPPLRLLLKKKKDPPVPGSRCRVGFHAGGRIF